MLTKELQNKVKDLWNKFWAGGVSNPLNAIEQITYLLFIKQLDELDTNRKNTAKKNKSKYTSIFDGSFIPPNGKKEDAVEKELMRWGRFSRMPQDEMFTHLQTLVFPFIKSLGTHESKFAKHMNNAVFILPKSSLLKDAVKAIDEIYDALKIENRYIDAQGDFYELLLNQLSGAGQNGQFRTPTHIIEMMVELVQPSFGKKIVDPACGSAGFLLGAYKYIVSQKSTDRLVDDNGFKRGSNAKKLSNEDERRKLEYETFYGFDIDPTMIRIGLMNLMMHGITEPQIDYSDTLSTRFNEDGAYDYVLANPPFTGSIDKGDINTSFELKTTKSELLFLERIYKMLKIGGTAGVVVPQGVLFGSNKVNIQIRQMLIDRCELKAVISMPSGVFKPYAGVSTAILVFTKGDITKDVWFYDMVSDGWSLDDKRTELFTKAGERDFGDLHQIIKAFKAKKKNVDRKNKHFSVPKQEIAENKYDLSFNKYHEKVFDEVVYDSPIEIIERLTSIEKKINEGLNELEVLLNEVN